MKQKPQPTNGNAKDVVYKGATRVKVTQSKLERSRLNRNKEIAKDFKVLAQKEFVNENIYKQLTEKYGLSCSAIGLIVLNELGNLKKFKIDYYKNLKKEIENDIKNHQKTRKEITEKYGLGSVRSMERNLKFSVDGTIKKHQKKSVQCTKLIAKQNSKIKTRGKKIFHKTSIRGRIARFLNFLAALIS